MLHLLGASGTADAGLELRCRHICWVTAFVALIALYILGVQSIARQKLEPAVLIYMHWYIASQERHAACRRRPPRGLHAYTSSY